MDDFGNVVDDLTSGYPSSTSSIADLNQHPAADVDVPGLVVEDEDAAAIRVALANALESAVEGDVRSGGVREVREIPIHQEDETTPLLFTGKSGKQPPATGRRWFGF